MALVVVAGLGLGAWGCATTKMIPGTTVPETDENHALLDTVELYRQRLLEKNIEGLLVLASRNYSEDSGTPNADDDYGYDGLKYVLLNRLSRLKSLHYEVKYQKVRVEGNKAEVEVYLTGAFELAAESGNRYRRVSDIHRFVLERSAKGRWQFLKGM